MVNTIQLLKKQQYQRKNTEVESEKIGDTIRIDLLKSNIHWKGTKMRGAGKHEGEIALQSGFLIKNSNQLVNGSFVADMTTIGVTDIPEHEPVPRDNLNSHLKSSDFFDVEKFPTSAFEITNVRQITSDSLLISGEFDLKRYYKKYRIRSKISRQVIHYKIYV